MRRVGLVLATLLLQVVVGRDYYWLPNSNWNNVDNWDRGRVPCESDTASFASVPANSLIYLNSNVTVRKIILPANGKLILKPSITIVLSDSSACTVDGRDLPPVVGIPPQVNHFTGAVSRSWECPQNWVRDDDLPAARPPCQDDNAIFEPDSAYSFVTSNQPIVIRSLTIRGEEVDSLQDLADEFRLADITVEPECETLPSLCPCPSQQNCEDVNECEVGLANCSTNGICFNTDGSFECQCNPGYEGDGLTCSDVDECTQGDLDRCDQNAQCTNTMGSFACGCNPGYEGDGFTCSDVDECTQGDLDRCDQNAQCTNTMGSFECQCNPGYEGDGFTCSALNVVSCTQGDLDRCDQNATCTNTMGSFACQCNPGYEGDGFNCSALNVVSEGSSQGSNAGGVAAGVVVAVLVVIIGVIVAVVGVILYMRHRRGSYTKDEALEPEDPVRYKPSQSKEVEDTVAFDNPMYDSNTGNVQLVGFQASEAPDDSNEKPPKLNEYERL